MYAVFAVYSTGDSFSRNDGEYMELVSFHKNKKLALENQATLEGFNKTVHEGGTVTLKFDSGGSVTRSVRWDGYFESLDYVEVKGFVVM